MEPRKDRSFQSHKHMLDVEAIGYELRPLFGHGSQQSFAAHVDERDLIEVDNASTPLTAWDPAFPVCSHLANPRTHQATVENPSHFRGAFAGGNPQHVRL